MLHRLFRRKPAPPPQPGPEAAAARLTAARTAHETQLSRINNALRQTGAGPLIAVPLCPAACEDTAIAAFLFQIGANPFDRWNMMYFAADAATARQLDTEQYRPEFDTLYDVEVTDVIGRVSIAWDSYLERFPSADPAQTDAFRRQLCDMLKDMSRDLARKIYPGRENKWQAFFAPLAPAPA